MKITNKIKTTHELIFIEFTGSDGKIHEKTVDIHRDASGHLISLSIGSKEISAFDLQLLEFLKKEGKL